MDERELGLKYQQIKISRQERKEARRKKEE